MQNFLNEAFTPAQLFAWLAALVVVVSFQKQSGRKTVSLWVFSDALMLMHFYLMHSPFLTLMAFGSVWRNVIALKYSTKALLVYIALYLFIIGGVCLLFDPSFMNIMAVVGTCFYSGAVIFKDNFIYHRAFSFFHQICWLYVFYALNSYGGLTLITFMFVSNIIGVTRYTIKQRSAP